MTQRRPNTVMATPMSCTLTIAPDASAAERHLRALTGLLTAAGISVALVRAPGRDRAGRLEADLLVAPADLDPAELVLASDGFRRRPGWGRRPHRFHLRPVNDPDTGRLDWLKVDLVTDLCFGPHHELATEAATACLVSRTAEDRRAARLAPADELASLLFHGLLDRPVLRPDQRARLRELAPSARRPGALAARYAPPGSSPGWDDLLDAIERDDWTAVLASRAALRSRLVHGRHVAATARSLRSRAGRRGVKALTAMAGRGPLVAFVGPDGTGKTTVTTALAGSAGLPSRVLYGGTYRSGTPRSAVPGLVTGQVLARLLRTRASIAWHRGRGRLVILDRHPLQVRPPTGDRSGARARARRRLLSVTLPPPDLLVVLDAPASVLHERRPEHEVALLERDRRRHLDLARRARGTEVLDATRPPDEVLQDAIHLVWDRAVTPAPHRSGPVRR